MKRIPFAIAAVSAIFATAANADSNVNSAPSGTVTASAAVDISLTVPVIVALRVGDVTSKTNAKFDVSLFSGPKWDGTINGAGVDTLLLSLGASVTPNGVGSGASAAGSDATVTAWAWTNNSSGAVLSCALSDSGVGGFNAPGAPQDSDFAAWTSASGNLQHPGTSGSGYVNAAALPTACVGTTNVPRNSLRSSDWNYSTSTTADLSKIVAGTYQRRVSYTLTAN